ncbi:hypothetical protein EBZ80_13940, partial [bacterium]|nr:hypothetical protein [bacterium]
DAEEALPFHLIVDEADKLAYGLDGPVKQQLEVLVDGASSVSFVTATAYEVMRDERFKCCDIYRLPRHPNYKGIEDLHWVEIPHKKKNARRDTSTTTGSPLERDPDLWHLVLERECDNDLFENGQPRIGLIKTESVIENQIKLANDIHVKMPDRFLTIVFNSSKIVIKCCELTTAIVHALKACKIKSKVKDGHSVCVTRSNIRDVLNAVRTRLFEDWSAIRPILIISDLVSQRGVHLRDSGYQWHLSFEVLRACKTTTVPALIQDLRILGIYADNVPLTLYCDKEVRDVLRLEIKALDEMTTRAKDDVARERPDMSIPEAITGMPLDVRKTTDRRQLRHGPARLPVRKVAPRPDGTSADGGFDLADYGIVSPPPPVARPVVAIARAVNGDVVGHAVDNAAAAVPPMDPAEFHHLTTKLFPKWARSDNDAAIARFFRSIRFDQTFRNMDEFKAYCQTFPVTVEHVMRPRGKWSFGQLFVIMRGGHVALHPQIRTQFERDFC